MITDPLAWHRLMLELWLAGLKMWLPERKAVVPHTEPRAGHDTTPPRRPRTRAGTSHLRIAWDRDAR